MSDSPAEAYAAISAEVLAVLAAHPYHKSAYFAARTALLLVRDQYGASAAAEMAYRLADEFAAEPRV